MRRVRGPQWADLFDDLFDAAANATVYMVAGVGIVLLWGMALYGVVKGVQWLLS